MLQVRGVCPCLGCWTAECVPVGRHRVRARRYCSRAGGDPYLTPTLTRMLLIFYHCDHVEVYRPLDFEIEVSVSRIYCQRNVIFHKAPNVRKITNRTPRTSCTLSFFPATAVVLIKF